MRVSHEHLERTCTLIFGAMGSPSGEAGLVSRSLVAANLMGHDSHGVGLVPTYVRHFADGLLKPGATASIVSDSGAILQFDGNLGFGWRVGAEAMEEAIGRCRQFGAAVMTLRNAHHLGRIGAYGEIAMSAGAISIHFVNVIDHTPLVAPWGGSAGRFVTNPVCIAVPGTGNTPALLLDMATSRIALGKARVAMTRGQDVGIGNIVDANGRQCSNPGVVFADPPGALLPFGEHKGSGLALMCEVLAGGLSGGGTIQPGNPRHGSIVNNMFTIIVDPERFAEPSWFSGELDSLIEYVKSSPATEESGHVLVAGEPERQAAEDRYANGIEIDEAEWQEILASGQELGLSEAELGFPDIGRA